MANKIRKNDEVVILVGKDKNKTGRVLSVDNKKGLVIVDKINMVKKHNKPTQSNTEGGIVEKEAAIAISNVAIKEKGKDGKATKVGFKINAEGKKIRIAKKTGKEL